ncbi:ABC transporter substrate-binding protein [Nocardia cyriacigeorgica]|uniref:ABC transporter substrate-binding protein n=1 Tax=Nocardia cyriacigeorgica TaxID=135487 RepID=UPI0015899B17|nr:ABC transporter substrate-binding protein [Nocardia cyriacigeorgica]MBF6455357.1 ABC transporter substrate-binding protein [Nocardia cyriacigeorgica]MBF6478942.1 ABC transporter substrate-binding protein [Nocardia cyriacigeorgica]MBF6553901.1 ABC transporter substrate-binding protein [Nocardia cyriacigeorgica]
MKHPIRMLCAAALAVTLAACGNPQAATGDLTVRNCGVESSFPAPAQRMFVNDSNMISMVLALGAQDQVAAVSSMQQDITVLREHYGDAVDLLRSVADESPSRETVLAQGPDVVVAGWNYGYDESKNLTPDSLRAAGIAAYILTESCRQRAGERPRGVVEPWTALREDLTNLGAITGRTERAAALVDDLDRRLAALAAAPKPARTPQIFLFDSGSDTIFSSGSFGAPQAILDAAGGRNVLSDVPDTWTAVSWERLAGADPDAIMFVDYPMQSYAQKVEMLRAKPGINQLRAVTEGRFLNLPYAMWTSGPLNIDAAEQIRKHLEQWGLVPPSDIAPRSDDAIR